MELQPVSETTVQPSEQRSLMERIGDKALYAISLSQVKIADTIEHVKRESGNIAARAALASLAIAGGAGFMAMESGTAAAAPVHTEGGGYDSQPHASLSFGWNVYLNFNHAATQEIIQDKDTGDDASTMAGAVCAFAPGPAAPVCGLAVAYETIDFNRMVDAASRKGECLQLKIPYDEVGMVVDPGIVAQFASKSLPMPNWGYEPCQS